MKHQQWNHPFISRLRFDMIEVDVKSLDIGHKLRVLIEPGFTCLEVVFILPIVQNCFKEICVHSVGELGIIQRGS